MSNPSESGKTAQTGTLSPVELYRAFADIDDKWLYDASLAAQRRRPTALRALLIAAVTAALVFTAAATVKIAVERLPGGWAEFFDDRVRVIFSGEEQSEGVSSVGGHLAEELEDAGISPAVLPDALGGGIVTDGLHIEKTELVTTACFRFSARGISGSAVISSYAAEAGLPQTDFPGAQRYLESDSGGINVLLLSQNGKPLITYSYMSVVYIIMPECTMEKAKEFMPVGTNGG